MYMQPYAHKASMENKVSGLGGFGAALQHAPIHTRLYPLAPICVCEMEEVQRSMGGSPRGSYGVQVAAAPTSTVVSGMLKRLGSVFGGHQRPAPLVVDAAVWAQAYVEAPSCSRLVVPVHSWTV